MPDCLLHVALAAATALSWLGAGAVVLAPLERPADGTLSLLNRFGAGALAFALLTFALGLVGALYTAVYVPLLVAAAAAGVLALVRERRGLGRPAPRTWRAWELALGGLVAAYVALEVVVTCAPVSSADALLHHAAAPELYAQTHRFEELPWTWNSYQPYTVEMLILDGVLLHDVDQGAFAPLLLALGTLAAIAGCAYRLLGRGGALVAASVFWAQPFTAWIATSTFVEPGTAFFVALAAWNLVEFARRGGTAPLVLAGVFAGGAAGTKYFGAVAAAVLCATAAIVLRDRLTWRRVALVAAPAALVALPWYVKNAVLTGDPFYPLLLGWPSAAARDAAYESLESYGFGTSPVDLAALPFRLLGDAEPFDRGEFMSPLALLFAPVALLAPRGRRVVAWTLAGCAAFAVAWFFGVQHARFLFAALPVLAVLAAHGVLTFSRAGRLPRLATVVVCAGALLAGAAITLVYAAQFVPVAIGVESRQTFLRENTPYYDGLEWLNDNLPPGSSIVLDHVLVLHSDAPAIAWTADALPDGAGPAELRAFVEEYDLTHAEVFAASAEKRRQLEAIGARPIARVTARAVTSRTLSELGPPEPMVVYELPRRR